MVAASTPLRAALLTVDERRTWDEHGFIVVRGALTAGELERQTYAIQEEDAA